MDPESPEDTASTTPHTEIKPHTNLKHSQTYESELDLVLEELSETCTIHSDTESILSLQCANNNGRASRYEPRASVQHTVLQPGKVRQYEPRAKVQQQSNKSHSSTSSLEENTEKCGTSTVQKGKQPDNKVVSRTCQSLPRNIKNVISNGCAVDNNMGSWPRKLSRNSTVSTDQKTANTSNHRRRSLSPGKMKSTTNTTTVADSDERIHSLIEEARRMSSINMATTTRPLSQPLLETNTIYTKSPTYVDSSVTFHSVSPYATANIIDCKSTEKFKRKPSYRIACSNNVSLKRVIPRSQSEGNSIMSRSYSNYPSSTRLEHQISDSILEDQGQNSEGYNCVVPLARAPSYRFAQSQSFDRSTRAPSYRKAMDTIPCERDSGLGSYGMTSSSDSSCSDVRMSSYRLATESTNAGSFPFFVAYACIVYDAS